MADGLIFDDKKNKSSNASNAQQASGNAIANPNTPLPTYNQATFGPPDPQRGYPMYPSPSPFPSPYVVSPLLPASPGQNVAYPPVYPNPQYQYPNMYQAPMGNIQQPQYFQQPFQYGQMNNPMYATPQQPAMYQPGYQPVFAGSDEKQVISQKGQSSEESTRYEPPPEHLGSEITTVRFTPVPLHGDDQDHAVKALIKAGEQEPAVLSAILGTYLDKKRTHERNRLQNSTMHINLHRHSTQDVAVYNHLMDKLEALSGTVLTKHRHALNTKPWTDAMNPHRRAIFAELYNGNPNVRGFCSEIEGGPTAFPVLDDWALGTRRHNLSFQKVGRQGPNWNVARELLSQVHTVILLDDSGSMASEGHHTWGYGRYDNNNYQSRWDQARDLMAGIAPLVSRYNRRGIDMHFLNVVTPFLGLHTENDVLRAFRTTQPGGGTPTGRRINEILDGYMCALRYNRSIMPLNLVVITDGEAQDELLLHWTIEHHVTKIVHRGFQAHQFGVEFLQVGDDEEATRHLEKLEEEVSRHHHSLQRDVVGVTPTNRQSAMSPDKLLGIILSGIDARMNGYMRHTGINV
jgi:hypothetical protein